MLPKEEFFQKAQQALSNGSHKTEDQEKLSGVATGLELLQLLKFLSSQFTSGFLYIHMDELSSAIFFQKGIFTECLIYSRIAKSLKQGGEALTKLVRSFSNGYGKINLTFQFFENPSKAPGRQERFVGKKVDQLIADAMVLSGPTNAYAQVAAS